MRDNLKCTNNRVINNNIIISWYLYPPVCSMYGDIKNIIILSLHSDSRRRAHAVQKGVILCTYEIEKNKLLPDEKTEIKKLDIALNRLARG